MRTILKSGIFTLVLALVAVSFTTSTEDIGHESSTINWTGTKVTGTHTGTIDFKTAAWKFDAEGALVSANFIVDMTSIKCTDLDEKNGKKLIGHLSSPDFFNTVAFPTAQFKTTAIKSLGKGDYEITGDMSIKDITMPLTFNANISTDGHVKNGTATIAIDRTKYDIKYGSGSFFDGLGDKMISDEFVLEVDIKKH